MYMAVHALLLNSPCFMKEIHRESIACIFSVSSREDSS